MPFLVYSDYINRANDQSIQQWIGANATILAAEELNAEEEIKSYIQQRYDITLALAPTQAFIESNTYQANSLIQLNFPAWVSGSYAAGAYVSWTDGNVYRCILAATTELPSNATYWKLVGPQLGFFYLTYPYPLFDVKGFYNVGDITYWKGKVYQALKQSICPDHYDILQDRIYANIPYTSVFPDDPVQGQQFWGIGQAYSVSGNVPGYTNPAPWAAGTYTSGQRATVNGVIWKCNVTSTTVMPGLDIINWQPETWMAGDNRNAQLVMYCTDITIWNLMPRIAPRAIPEKRKTAYEMAIMWLQRVADGKVGPTLQPIQGKVVTRTRFGGNVKNINGY